MSYDYLYEYYKDKGFAPTFANFKTSDDLNSYATIREHIFTHKLMLPPRVFENANVLEFGPDTGENALVFAQWGANMHLVEPNEGVHGQIEDYFKHFSLESHLKAIHNANVEDFKPGMAYETIIAEGFIYTIQPEMKWLQSMSELTAKNGFVVTSYYERHGGFLELSLKALVAAYIRMTGEDPISAAKVMFQKKWDSIFHTRTIESWSNDVLFNPFVRLEYFIDAQRLLTSANDCDFKLYSSWPLYRQPMKPYWHKKVLSQEEALGLDCMHIQRSQLSFLLGDMAYMSGTLTDVEDQTCVIENALVSIDKAIETDSENKTALLQCSESLDELDVLLQGKSVLCESENKRTEMRILLKSLQNIFKIAASDDPVALAQICAQDQAFINAWGIPTHYAVFSKN